MSDRTENDPRALDAIRVTLRGKGDGRKRTEEVVVEAVAALAALPELREAWRRHPNLRSLSPNDLLGKVSRKRAGRVVESGLLAGSYDDPFLEADAIFARGRELDVTVPLAMLLAEMDLLPPVPSASLANLPILYQSPQWLAFDKPSGLPSAPIRSDETDSVVHRALRVDPCLPILRGNPLEPGLVHRLDTGTSGVLLFARTAGAFEKVDRIWNDGRVRKIYQAITEQRPSRKGKIEIELGHDAKSKRRMRVVEQAVDRKRIRSDAHHAVSEIMSVDAVPAGADGTPRYRVTIRIETGIHHQIRATLAHLGAPILGDSVYGGTPENRLWLHAWRLEIPGENGNPLEIVAPPPF